MARIRSIKPEFNTSEAIASLSIPAQLHFVKLWTYADDAGRGIDNPRVIAGQLWPLAEEMGVDDVEGLQRELAAAGRIVRYDAEGRRFFQIVNWSEHQKPQHPKDSTIPEAPPEAHRENPLRGREEPHEHVPSPGAVVVVEQVDVVESSSKRPDGGDVIHETCVLIAERKADRFGDIADRTAWVQAHARGLRTTLEPEIMRVLATHPEATASQLARYLNGEKRVFPPKAVESDCDECRGRGETVNDAGDLVDCECKGRRSA